VKGLPEEASSTFEIRVLPDPDEAARAAALETIHASRDALGNRGVFHVALSGGTTPVLLFRELARPPFRESIDREHTRFFFVDERCVPPDHGRSNYRLAKENLFDPLGIPPDHVFRMRGEEDPETAAREYGETLARELARTGPVPSLDLVLLGLGEDGHTASLFPETAALGEDRRWVVANRVPKLAEWRLTLTLPVLNAARRAVFLATGAGKSAVVAAITQRKEGSRDFPASLVRPTAGPLIFILDEAAAADL
jgi:6-phosphogluconolactonase